MWQICNHLRWKVLHNLNTWKGGLRKRVCKSVQHTFWVWNICNWYWQWYFPGYPLTPSGIFWTLWQLGFDHRPLHPRDVSELLQQVANAAKICPDKSFVLENVETTICRLLITLAVFDSTFIIFIVFDFTFVRSKWPQSKCWQIFGKEVQTTLPLHFKDIFWNNSRYHFWRVLFSVPPQVFTN